MVAAFLSNWAQIPKHRVDGWSLSVVALCAFLLGPVIALLISTIFEGYVWAPLSFVGLALVMAGNVMMIRARD